MSNLRDCMASITPRLGEHVPDSLRVKNWPQFSRVKYEVDGKVAPEISHFFSQIGVPRSLIGREYVCVPQERLNLEGAEEDLIQFGKSGFFGKIFVENPNGRIVQVVGDDCNDRNIVNSSLEAFSSCVELVISRFPFYGIETIDDAEIISDSLAAELLVIDPLVDSHNGFWETFLSDLSIGDYTTENVVP